jgi:hypothetical protein
MCYLVTCPLNPIAPLTPTHHHHHHYHPQDGTIALEMKLTGILSTSVHEEADKVVPHGISVAPGVVASNHQHLFCVRIDPAVDDPNGVCTLISVDHLLKPLRLPEMINKTCISVVGRLVQGACYGRRCALLLPVMSFQGRAVCM